MLSGDSETCTVTFDGYGTTVIARLSDLRPRGWEDEEEEGSGLKKKKLDARPNAKLVIVFCLSFCSLSFYQPDVHVLGKREQS